MKTYFIFALLLSVIFFGCSKDDEAALTLADFPVPVEKVEAGETDVSVGETVAITVTFVVNNGCGQFGRFEEQKSGTTTIVKVYPFYREGYCTQALMPVTAVYNFKPSKTGTYTIKFWAGEDQYITKTIQVK